MNESNDNSETFQSNSEELDEQKNVYVEDFSIICRICLSKEDLIPIASCISENNQTLAELLKQHFQLEWNLDDNLPQNICTSCASSVYRFHLFKEELSKNDDLLKNVLREATEMKCKVEYLNSSDDDSIKTEPKMEKPRKREFRCGDCLTLFNTKSNLSAHRKEMQHFKVWRRKIECSYCGKLYPTGKMRLHMRVHTKEQPFQCEVCFQTFSMKNNLQRHMMTHTGERPYKCKTCGKGFIQLVSLQTHLKTHKKLPYILQKENSNNGYKYICKICERPFRRIANFIKHVKQHDNLKGEEVSEEEIKEHICKECGKGFETKHLLKKHSYTHGEKCFLCSECGKGFISKTALQSHFTVHSGEKQYTCEICKKSYAHFSAFDSHKLTHLGIRPFSCNLCDKKFTQKSHLRYHKRTHSGEKPYTCSLCEKSFALKGNLTVHTRTHTGETPHLCNNCGKGFNSTSSLKKHKCQQGQFEKEEEIEDDDLFKEEEEEDLFKE